MAMEMHGMRCFPEISKMNTDRRRSGKVIDVPIEREGRDGSSLAGKKEQR